MSATILLIEDNPQIMEINRDTLLSRGFRVLEAETIAEGRALFQKETPHLIILDILLPDGNGLSLCKEVKGDSNVPILFVTALGHNNEIVEGLRAGGDDYLPKPYDIKVLVERVNALLRRSATIPDAIVKGTMRLETYMHQAFVDGQNLGLTRRQFDLLLYLTQNEDRLISTEALYKKVWGSDLIDDANAIKTAISRLRGKIEPSGYTVDAIRNKGYIFTKM